MSSSIDPLIGSMIAVTVLAVFCTLWVAFRRLRGMQVQIDELRRNIRTLEGQYSGLLVRQLNRKSSSRKAPKRSNPPSDTPQETVAAPLQPNEGNSKGAGLRLSIPKTIA